MPEKPPDQGARTALVREGARRPTLKQPRQRVRWPVIGVRWRLVLLVVIALAPSLLLYLFHTQTQRAELVLEAQNRALHLARTWADNHDAVLREANLILEAVLRDPTIVNNDPTACGAALRNLAARVMWTAPLAVVDRQGKALCTTETGSDLLGGLSGDFINETFRSRALEVSEFRAAPDGRSFAVAALHQPAPTALGAVDRAAVALIDLAEIQRRTAREAAGAQFNIMVIGRGGIILARDPEAAGFVGSAIGSEHPLMPDIQTMAEGVAEGTGRDGVDRIFSFTQLPQTGAKIAVGLARADVLGRQEREANNLLVLLGIVALLTVAGGWLLGELSIVRWVAALGRSAEAFGRGELDRREILPRQAGEFAGLSASFNRMAASLAARRHALEAANRALETQATALAAAKEVAETASRAKSDFLATMSHELRTPLNAIIGFADIMQREMLGPIGVAAYRDYAQDILASGNHLLSLISDILDFVKADSGRLQLGKDDVDLSHVARAVFRMLLPQAEAAGVTLAVEAEADGVVAWGDERWLKQVLINLAGNAVKFTPARGNVTIAVFQRHDGAAEMLVRDTGIGIAPAELPRVVEPFKQVDGSFSRKQEGIGLGLAICDRLIRLHGGTLSLVSALGKGTTATVVLPSGPERPAIA